MNTDWIVAMFLEAGVGEDVARKAAMETLGRMLRRQRPLSELLRRRDGVPMSAHLVRDPLISLARILGVGDERLPFIDDDRQLSVVSFGEVLSGAGMDPVVAIAYAKVIQAAFDPSDLYQPIWEILGGEGRVALEDLEKMDFEPVRACWTEFDPRPPSEDVPEGRARAEEIRRARGTSHSGPKRH